MKKLLSLGLVLCAVGGGVVFFWSEPPPIEPEFVDDTGMTRFQTEELMREIGYVQ
jgi:hypothetical protein